MQAAHTHSHPAQPSSTSSYLKDLDYSVVQQCMHCGLCLPTCPTYDSTKLERNSPRGRISLMRSIADGGFEATRAFGEEMYFCLGCLACMTACPAGVNYAELFEHARAEVESKGVLDNPQRSLIRSAALRWLFDDLNRLKLLGRAIRIYQDLGLEDFLRGSGLLALLPERLRQLESMSPKVCEQFSEELISLYTPARGETRYRVAVLTGCAQDLIFSDVNRDTVEVLIRNGCDVITPRDQSCCGSLHAHNGELELAKTMARRQIDQIPPDRFDAIITNAAGCGSHLKHYASILAGDPDYETRARLWDSKVKDIHEWLAKIGIKPPAPSSEACGKVTYHEACHLCHGQKITAQPRTVLKSIPGLELVELNESTWCCGSAGVYNITQPEMAGELLDRKLDHIRRSGAPTVATGNPGCLLHLRNGARKAGDEVQFEHPISLLAAAYRAGEASAAGSPRL